MDWISLKEKLLPNKKIKIGSTVTLLNEGDALVNNYRGQKIFTSGQRYVVKAINPKSPRLQEGEYVNIVSGEYDCWVHINQLSL